jgi:hypothetical protein
MEMETDDDIESGQQFEESVSCVEIRRPRLRLILSAAKNLLSRIAGYLQEADSHFDRNEAGNSELPQ